MESDVPGCCSVRVRGVLFRVGDALFLVLVSGAATVLMCLAHRLEWGFIAECAVGMIAAMLLQMLLAFCVAPVLGSIEAMVPSMPVAMVAPMVVCLLHAFDCRLGWLASLALGSAFGGAMFALVEWYAAACRRSGVERFSASARSR